MRVREGMILRPEYMGDVVGMDVKVGECKVLEGLNYFPVVYDDLSSCIMCAEDIENQFVEVE